jgi:multidrug resistance efflux pump
MAGPKRVFLGILVLMCVTVAALTFYYWYNNANYIRTEDAYLDGVIFKAGPQVGGRLLEMRALEGRGVTAGDIIARVDDPSLPSGGNIDLTLVKAPITGVVLKVLSRPGEVVAPGQPVVMLVDLRDVYLTVNVEEKKIARVELGQRVSFTVDGIPEREFEGRVSEVTDAVAATFSLLPTRTTSGSFVKVSQRVPVKVHIENADGAPFRIGQSAVVRIHLRE